MRVENDNRFHVKGLSQPRLLSGVPLEEWVQIERLDGPGEDCRRLVDLGFTPGEEVSIAHTAPFGDPFIVRVRGTQLALRKREAAWIWVK